MKLPGLDEVDDARTLGRILKRAADVPTAVLRDTTRTLVERVPSSSSTCKPGDDSGRCQKPVSNSTETLPIVLGVVIPISCAIIVFIFLHRRNKKKQALEDINDPHKSLDFGLDVNDGIANPGRSKRGMLRNKRDAPEMLVTEMAVDPRGRHHPRGLSMDMLGSPYMLPSGPSDSHESLHSMSRSARDEHDPYRPVTFVRHSSETSRSPRPFNDKASVYSASTNHTGFNDRANLMVNAQRMSQSYPNRSTSNLLPEKRAGDSGNPLPPPPVDATVAPRSLASHQAKSPEVSVAELNTAPTPSPQQEGEGLAFPFPQELPADSQHPTSSPPPAEPRPPRTSSVYVPSNAQQASLAVGATATTDRHASDMSHYEDEGPPPPPPAKDFDFGPQVQQAPEFHATYEDYDTQEVEDYGYDIDPSMISTGRHSIDGGQPSHDLPPQINRMSLMGVRPLPPDHPEENAEQRANRIRSFYKEYFDPGRPMTQGPAAYYEDYDAGYAEEYFGDGWYDPETGAYYETPHAPYAQPVGRRAMTPPPQRGPRFAGAHDRHYSTMSAGRGQPRGRPPPKKKLPPPKALTSLPTPHQLKSDSALFTSVDFAPPTSFREMQNGRGPDSPTGTSRPFNVAVRAYSPLVSPFESLNPMPSPHQLRKSGTFTSLDFSPQVPRFMGRGDGTGSDSGSIRSARSGISAMHQDAVRSGAYRVSRIPKEFVTSREDLTNRLRPKMDLTTPA